jgi:predicted methyltransferase
MTLELGSWIIHPPFLERQKKLSSKFCLHKKSEMLLCLYCRKDYKSTSDKYTEVKGTRGSVYFLTTQEIFSSKKSKTFLKLIHIVFTDDNTDILFL